MKNKILALKDKCLISFGTNRGNNSMFEEFNKQIKNYNPRDYILREHSLLKSAESYIKLLEKK